MKTVGFVMKQCDASLYCETPLGQLETSCPATHFRVSCMLLKKKIDKIMFMKYVMAANITSALSIKSRHIVHNYTIIE